MDSQIAELRTRLDRMDRQNRRMKGVGLVVNLESGLNRMDDSSGETHGKD